MIGKNVIERSWHTIRFLAFHKFSLSFGCLLLRLVLAVSDISYAWMFFSGFSATSTPRRDFDKTFITGHRGRWRLCMVLRTAWVERMISNLTTLARRCCSHWSSWGRTRHSHMLPSAPQPFWPELHQNANVIKTRISWDHFD